MHLTPVTWRDGQLFIIDQTLLPSECREIRLASLEAVREAICALRVRGAPAIGVCAAFGLLVALEEMRPADIAAGLQAVDTAAGRLETSRPTAVNLFWALRRMRHAARAFAGQTGSLRDWRDRLEREACALRDEDTACCQRIGDYGATLIPEGAGVLTHCNAGALATSAYGTALAALYRAHESGRAFRVYADETPPAAGRAPHRVGTPAGRHRRDPHLRQHGRPGHAGRPRATRDHRGRPHRSQR